MKKSPRKKVAKKVAFKKNTHWLSVQKKLDKKVSEQSEVKKSTIKRIVEKKIALKKTAPRKVISKKKSIRRNKNLGDPDGL